MLTEGEKKQMIALQFFSKYLSLRLGLRRPTSLVRGRRTVSVLCRVICAFCDTGYGVGEIPTAVCALPRNDVRFWYAVSFVHPAAPPAVLSGRAMHAPAVPCLLLPIPYSLKTNDLPTEEKLLQTKTKITGPRT